MLNGVPGVPIKHGRGLRQGDPLSPLLFIITIDPLQKIFDLATEKGYIAKLGGRTVPMRTSMYADDTPIFIKPTKNDVAALADLLTMFGEANGLKTNFHKSMVVPICCDTLSPDEIHADLPAKRSHFPVKYLGLPLTTWRLRQVDFQPLADKAVSKLTHWNGRNINPAGHMTLVKSVLTSQAVYFRTALKAPKAALGEIDGKRKQFLWAGSEILTGAKCKVN